MNKVKKNELFYFLLLILTLITMIIGVTFTYFALMASEKEDSTRIQTGTLAINYIDGQAIDTYLLLPINEPNLDSKYSVYKKEFAVSSTGTLDQNLDIYIDIKHNDFSNNALKFAIYDVNNNKMATGFIPKEGKILMTSGYYLKSGSTANFTVLIWLQENNQNQDYEQGSTFSGGFDITAKQVELK